jgi:hypothetical protein
MPDEFEYQGRLVDETLSVDEQAGGARVRGKGRLQVGKVVVHAEVDPENATAKGRVEATTVRVDVDGAVTAPGDAAGVEGDAYAEGPAAHVEGEVGPDGVGGQIGVSAGTAGAHGGVEILGKDFRAGVDVGLKAELGLKWGPTSRIDLPLISVEGPNPMAAATSWAVEAGKNLAEDPLGTLESAGRDVIGVPEGVVDAVGDLFDDDVPDDKAVTTDEQSGPRAPLKPGQKPID